MHGAITVPAGEAWKAIAVGAPVTEQFASGRQDQQQLGGTLAVVHLAFDQQHCDGPTTSVTACMELGTHRVAGEPGANRADLYRLCF